MCAAPAKLRPDIFAWSAKYKIGIAEIDLQHKKLVRLINSLARMQVEQADGSALSKVFDELANYAAYHFKKEEELMGQYRVDAAFEAGHKNAHAQFIRYANEGRSSADERPSEVTTQTLTFLSRWLIFHILGTDMRMADEIRGLERGLTPEEAKRQAIEHMSASNEVLLDAMSELYENLALRTHDFIETNQRLREEIEFNRRSVQELRKLSLVVERSPAAIIITDAQGLFEYVNPKFVDVTGYTIDELRGMTPRVLKSGETAPAEYADLWATISSGRPWSGEFHNRKKDGELYWDKASITPIVAEDGRITNYLSIQQDISAQKDADAELSRSHAQLAASLAELQHQARDLTLLNQTNELLQTCLTSDEAYRVIAHMADQLGIGSGGSLAVVNSDRHMSCVSTWGVAAPLLESFGFDSCWAIRRGQRHGVTDTTRGLVCSHFKEPPTAPYICVPLVVLGETLGLLHVGFAADSGPDQIVRLTRLAATVGEALKLSLSNIRLREALREQASRDPLTGLYNRRYLEESLQREVRRAQRENVPLSVLMIDIDHFKSFNDQFGHEAGDRVLVEVSNCIRANLRKSDVACRFGGEEIAVLMPASTAVDVRRRVDNLIDQLKVLNLVAGENALPRITISAGIATLPEHGNDADALLRSADHALYAAKRAGRNRVIVAEAESSDS
jgi:diguanylate cyclase (GGDEF)-like protein/hemerythrin-like metal-binding protein/PAS domain S-box-containing protein